MEWGLKDNYFCNMAATNTIAQFRNLSEGPNIRIIRALGNGTRSHPSL